MSKITLPELNSTIAKNIRYITSAGTVKPNTLDTSLFTPENTELLSRVNNLIDKTWTKFKTKKIRNVQPNFEKKYSNGKLVTLKPIYYGLKNEIMLSVEKGESIEQVLIPKDIFNAVKYERMRKTQFGTATTRTYNSRLGYDKELNLHVNALLGRYLPDFLPRVSKIKR